MIVRSGVDLVEISRFVELQGALRKRFLERVFTEGEMADCAEHEERLAGRFAVKEAVAKALGTGIGAFSWKDIETRSNAQGAPVLVLHGKARDMAAQLGLTEWSVSISHTRQHAIAIATALGESTSDRAV